MRFLSSSNASAHMETSMESITGQYKYYREDCEIEALMGGGQLILPGSREYGSVCGWHLKGDFTGAGT